MARKVRPLQNVPVRATPGEDVAPPATEAMAVELPAIPPVLLQILGHQQTDAHGGNPSTQEARTPTGLPVGRSPSVGELFQFQNDASVKTNKTAAERKAEKLRTSIFQQCDHLDHKYASCGSEKKEALLRDFVAKANVKESDRTELSTAVNGHLEKVAEHREQIDALRGFKPKKAALVARSTRAKQIVALRAEQRSEMAKARQILSDRNLDLEFLAHAEGTLDPHAPPRLTALMAAYVQTMETLHFIEEALRKMVEQRVEQEKESDLRDAIEHAQQEAQYRRKNELARTQLTALVTTYQQRKRVREQDALRQMHEAPR